MGDVPETVDEYLGTLPPGQRAVLAELREAIRSAAPQAEEVISYRIPLYKHHGHLVGFAAFKHHLSLFVTASDVREQLATDLEPYEVKNTAIHFTTENPLPAALVRKIVQLRVAENEANAKR